MLEHVHKKELEKIMDTGRISYDQPLAPYTSFGIGGPADVLVQAEREAELQALLHFCQKHAMPRFILGKGTNLLVLDKGIRGMVIHLSGILSYVEVKENTVIAGGGASLADAAAQAARAGLTGMEFAQGIPGSIGGAVIMNAGAYGGEMKDIVTRVHVLSANGQPAVYRGVEMAFGYRVSVLQGTNAIVTKVEMTLQYDDPAEIRIRTEDLQRRRWDKQPLNLPSAGSVFRRPTGFYAGALIEKAGLKGYRIGGAQVSEKHAGFIVNIGQATAADVIALICHIQKTVREQSGVLLEPEIRIVGEE
jgi:UDP-N-acetylmuramate dehydrogenase